VTLDHDSQDNNDSTPKDDVAPSAVENTVEQPAAAPRRRATRARTAKKAAAPVAAEFAEGQLTFPTPDGTDAGADSAEPVDEAEAVVPVKRVRAPRKRSAPRAAPRTAVEPSAEGETTVAADLAQLADLAELADLADQAIGDSLAGVAGTEATPAATPATDVSSSDDADVEPAKKAPRRRSRKATSPAFSTDPTSSQDTASPDTAPEPAADATEVAVDHAPTTLARVPIMPLFQAPEPVAPRARRAASRPAGPPKAPAVEITTPATESDPADQISADQISADAAEAVAEIEVELGIDLADDVAPEEIDVEIEDVDDEDDVEDAEDAEEVEDAVEQEGTSPRRRRRRGGRGRRGRGRTDAEAGDGEDEVSDAVTAEDEESQSPAVDAEVEADGGSEDDEGEEAAGESSGSRRRRRRRRRGSSGAETEVGAEEGANVVVKVREPRRDDVTAVRGSTRLEAKKQRRREGREAGRRRTILTEAEFLTRRESVDRVMVVREREGRTQIGVLEDGLLVEHYVARKTQTSTVGNVYLGRVQNVLPSMEAAFIDIGKGRNAVLYAGEVNWDAAGLDGGQPRRIEHALKAGEAVLVQVTKDPIGHKGARLTSQISMPGRYLVYVPDGSMTGISRKLPDTERSRLKKILREIVPDDAGVIVRTAAEGASDEELERDVARLRAQWEDIAGKIKTVQAPAMLYGEPDLAIKVVRDIFNEDFGKLIVSGDDAWDTLQGYISHVAPDLEARLERWTSDTDVFGAHRIDEQLAKALDRKVYLPSGGSLVIDRTEAMTVVDVNTGKFTGSGGNLEETVTKNNLEAAEEVVHQLRLRDIGGIIVVDFIDMVLESNRDLVLRRLLECLGRDRTRHQVAEVTSLGLVQMTRKRVGQGLIEVFSETCEHCGGRGLIMHDEPVEKKPELILSTGNSGGGGGNGGSSRRSGRSHAH
jgi:ribonuclease E